MNWASNTLGVLEAGLCRSEATPGPLARHPTRKPQLSARKSRTSFSRNKLLALSFKGTLEAGRREAAAEGRAASPGPQQAGQHLSSPLPSGKSRAMTATTAPQASPAHCRPPQPTAPPRHRRHPQTPPRRPARTRISGMRTGLIAGVAALIVVMIFVIQNAHAVTSASWARTCTCRWPSRCSSPPSQAPWRWPPPEPLGSPSCGGSCDVTGATRKPAKQPGQSRPAVPGHTRRRCTRRPLLAACLAAPATDYRAPHVRH